MHDQYKELKKHFGWSNKDVARITGNTEQSIATVTQPGKSLPRWLKLAIKVFEEMKKQ